MVAQFKKTLFLKVNCLYFNQLQNKKLATNWLQNGCVVAEIKGIIFNKKSKQNAIFLILFLYIYIN